MNLEAFKKTVWNYYKKNKRDNMPWRKTTNPYYIMVSEIMLQQTQVARVIEKYNEFIQLFPDTKTLAQAPLSDVLKAWQGLGYNRRAKFLKQAAEIIESEYNSRFPQTPEELIKLPGIGKNTAGAIMAYAFNTAVPYIETNVRTVYIYHFFKDKENITDKEIEDILIETIDYNNPKEWYWAIMDYGTYLKKTYGNNIQKSKHYKKQSKFIGSNRQKRAAIIRYLTHNEVGTLQEFIYETKGDKNLIQKILKQLQQEDMIEQIGTSFVLKE
jgi:A/G-specific adenine glycosylase